MATKQTQMRIVVVDDNQDFVDSCRKKIRKVVSSEWSVEEHSVGDLAKAIHTLDRVRSEMRKLGNAVKPAPSLFDGSDVVLIDYDLIELEGQTALTGEDIAYLLRCYTNSGVIVLLNPPELGTEFFDLRLRGRMDSWADLWLGSEQVDNKWLWSAESSGFAPWHWPEMKSMVLNRRRQVQAAKKSLDAAISDVVGLHPSSLVLLDHEMRAFAFGSPGVQDVEGGVTPRTIRTLVRDSEYGAHRRDNAKGQLSDKEESLARIGAARIASWLERVVLPAQTLLIDAPHIVMRLPGLLKGDVSKRATWNATAIRGLVGLGSSMRCEEIEKCRVQNDVWLSRPAWMWPLLSQEASFVPWSQAGSSSSFVFCEDTSKFEPKSRARPFIADVPAQASLRYVRAAGDKCPPLPRYRPAVRFAL